MTTIEQLKANYDEAYDNYCRAHQNPVAFRERDEARAELHNAQAALKAAEKQQLQAGFDRLAQLKRERGIA